MRWSILAQCFSTLLELVLLRHPSDGAKDLQILLLRRQLEMVQRKLDKPLLVSRAEKFSLALLTTTFKPTTGPSVRQFSDVIRSFQPETVRKGHRELVGRKWDDRHPTRTGRPKTDAEVERLVLQLARANDWGNGKSAGERLKLGFELSDQTIANRLKPHGIPPLPQPRPSLSWRHRITHSQQQIRACDFFTLDPRLLQTLYGFCFIELGTGRVYFAGCTAHPTGAWVTQPARQLVWEVARRQQPLRLLIHDRDSPFTTAFDAVFASEPMKVIRTPFRAPNANA